MGTLATIGTLVAKMVLDTGAFEKGAQTVETRSEQMQRRIVDGATIAGAAVGTIGVGLLKVGGEYKAATDAIRISTGEVGQDLVELEDQFKVVAGRVPDSLGVVGQALADVRTRTGLLGDDLGQLTESFLDASRLLDVDVSTAIDKVTRLYGDWGVAQMEQLKTNDLLLRASQASGFELDKLADQLVQFGAPLRNIGMDLEDSVAMLSKWEKEGVNTQLALGGLKIALGEFAKEGIDAKVGLDDLIDRITNAGTAAEAMALGVSRFGSRAGPDMVAAIREGRFEFADFRAELVGGSETIQGLSDDTRDFGDTIRETMNRIKTFIGPALKPLGGIAEALGNAIFLLPALGGALGRGIGKAANSDAVRAAVSKAGAVISAKMSAAMTGAQALFGFLPKSITGAAQRALPAATLAGTTLGTAFGVAFKAAAIVGIAIVGALIIQELGKKARNIVDEIFGTNTSAGDRAEAMRADMKAFGESIGIELDNVHELVIGKMAANGNDMNRALGKLGGLSAETFEREYQRAWTEVKLTNGPDALAAAQADLERQLAEAAALTVPPPDVAGPMKAEMAAAVVHVREGIGNIKQALKNPPQFISKEDRLDNMATRVKKITKNLNRAIKEDDPWAQDYWASALLKQETTMGNLKNRTVGTMGQIKRELGLKTKGTVDATVDDADLIAAALPDALNDTVPLTRAALLKHVNAIDETYNAAAINSLVSGTHLGANLAAGMRAAIPDVAAASAELAAAAAGSIKFSRPPTTGPLSTIRSWMPHMVDQWLGPLAGLTPRLKAASDRLGAALVPELPAVALSGRADGRRGSGGEGGEVHNHWHIGTLIADDGGIDQLERRMQRRQRLKGRHRRSNSTPSR